MGSDGLFKEAIMIKTILLFVTLFGGFAGSAIQNLEAGARVVGTIIQQACDDVDPDDEDHFE